jgi:F0F1-type ATP synthase assembly protein I
MKLFGPERGNRLKTTNRHMAVGTELGVAVLIGAFGGYYLDRRFGTTPWLMIFGLAIGAAAGFKSLLRLAKPPSPPKK